ncbi:MAG: PD40 domain-containing protein [Deltaproteobacteria bacterium]|nr:PD40 domain-containing protein [Deltaproteobacteria bacterium]
MKPKTKKILAICLLLAMGVTLVFTPWGRLPCPFCELYRLGNFIWAPQPSEDLTQRCNLTRLTTSSVDDRNPIWSPDGSKVFFKSDNRICVCNADGSQREELAEIKESFVFSPDMKRVFYVKRITPDNIMEIARNDPEVKGEIKALEDEYGARIEEYKVGIADNIANLVVVLRVPVATEANDHSTWWETTPKSSAREEKTHVLDIYIDLRTETVTEMERIETAKVPVGEEKEKYMAYVMDIDGKNQQKIAELTLEEKYVDDGGYIGSTRGPMYDMHSWSPDRTKIFFTKLEETGYTWVWRQEEGKWVRYKAGTEPSVPVEEFLGQEQRLIAKEHERTAWIWDLKDNELRSIVHLSYGIVAYPLEGEVVWSPDGKYVALPCVELSEAGATEQIFVVNVETGESKKLTSFVESSTWPKWSLDSKKITYIRVPPKYWYMPFIFDSDEGSDIWVVDIDGSNEKQLTDIPMNWEDGFWSPDGSKIAYISWKEHDSKFEIWIMNADGSDKKLLVKDIVGWVAVLEWSPDGSKMAFDTPKIVEGKHDRDIYVIDVPSEK